MPHSITDNLWGNQYFDKGGLLDTLAQAEERKRAEREAMEAMYPPNLGMKFRQMDELCEELGAEAFKDMAPQMYGIYKEMKTIRDFQKMAKLLED